MSTPHDFLFHCITCGRIEHRDSDLVAPECCGQSMSMTVKEAPAKIGAQISLMTKGALASHINSNLKHST